MRKQAEWKKRRMSDERENLLSVCNVAGCLTRLLWELFLSLPASSLSLPLFVSDEHENFLVFSYTCLIALWDSTIKGYIQQLPTSSFSTFCSEFEKLQSLFLFCHAWKHTLMILERRKHIMQVEKLFYLNFISWNFNCWSFNCFNSTIIAHNYLISFNLQSHRQACAMQIALTRESSICRW